MANKKSKSREQLAEESLEAISDLRDIFEENLQSTKDAIKLLSNLEKQLVDKRPNIFRRLLKKLFDK